MFDKQADHIHPLLICRVQRRLDLLARLSIERWFTVKLAVADCAWWGGGAEVAVDSVVQRTPLLLLGVTRIAGEAFAPVTLAFEGDWCRKR